MTKNLAIYIHWPFCKSKCPYCDFNSHVAETIDHEAWKQAYLKEIKHYARKLSDRNLTSIYFGGGTPSLMKPSTVEAILSGIGEYWPSAKDVEITLEANPTSVEVENLRNIKTAGVNRISMGIQSFDDNNLKFLGRGHNADGAKHALNEIRQIFSNYSFDLIYALPKQTIEELSKELSTALDFCANHLSLYQLTIEKGTPFFTQHSKGEFSLPDEDVATEMYEVVEEMASKKGLIAYEVSNYAKQGFESRHNLTYWQYGEYVGIGPGAHGRLATSNGRMATVNIHHPGRWLSAVNEKGLGIQQREPIEGTAYLEEYLLMGLRLKDGISNDNFLQHFGQNPTDIIDLDYLKRHELLEVDRKGFRVTKQGRLLLNSVVAKLLSE